MNGIRLSCILILTALSMHAQQALAQAYTYSTVATVGYIQVAGGRAGVAVWTQKSSTAFQHCTMQPTHMWTDTDVVSEEASKSMLAVLTTAKALDVSVTVYYVVNSNGNCMMRHLALN